MMTDWLLRFVVTAGACVAVAVTLSAPANADCCICSGCQAGGIICVNDTSCGFGCGLSCASAGCGDNRFDSRACSAIIPVCAPVVAIAPAGGAALYLSLTLVLATIGLFALRRRSLPIGVRAAAAALVLLSTAVGLRALTQMRLSGEWQLDSTAPAGSGLMAPPEPWSADLAVNEDGSISGTVTGFSDLDVARVDGTVHDGVVTGTLRAGDGPTVATFEGTLANDSLRGTFTKVESGETGTFSWHVPAS